MARIILPEVSNVLKKNVKVGAVMMAINRLSPASELRIRKNIKKLSLDLGDVIVRSDLCDFTFKNTPSLFKEIAKILTKSSENADYFLTVSQGIFETNIVTSKNLQPFVREVFEKEGEVVLINKLSGSDQKSFRVPISKYQQIKNEYTNYYPDKRPGAGRWLRVDKNYFL